MEVSLALSYHKQDSIPFYGGHYKTALHGKGLVPCPLEARLVFEDSMPGIQAAQNAGMKVIALAASHPAERLQSAERVVKDFAEISFKLVWDFLLGNSRRIRAD
jgi:hypothetical protein